METLATKFDIDRVFNKLEAYTTLEAFNKMKIQQELENENLQAKIKTLVQNSQLEIEIDRMKDHVAEVNRFNASKREAARDKKELLEKIETLHKSFTLLQEDQDLSKARLETLEQGILDKAERESVDEINETLKILPSKEEVIEMRDHVRTSLEKFSKQNTEFSG